jgi:hypothetical protein
MLPEVFADPRLAAVLVLAIAAVLWYQRGLSWAEYRRLHALKVRFIPLLDRFNVFVISHKGYRDDAEYLQTVDGTVRDVWQTLVDAGADPHLVNSIKKRPLPDGGFQYSAAHVVWNYPETGEQLEAYIFDNGDGTSDVYAHAETWTLDPDGHFEDPQTDGDPRGVVRAALDA